MFGFPRTWKRSGSPVGTAFHLHTPKKSANSESKNLIAVHKRTHGSVRGAISDGCPYRDSDPLVSQINRDWQTWVHFPIDRKSTRLNSSHANTPYAVFCL